MSSIESHQLIMCEKESLISMIEELRKKNEELTEFYDGCSRTYQKLHKEFDKCSQDNEKLIKENKRVRKEERRFKKLVDEEKIVTEVLEDFLDRRMGYEGCFGEGIIPDSRPTVQCMEKYPTEYEEVIYKRYGKIDEEDPKHMINAQC